MAALAVSPACGGHASPQPHAERPGEPRLAATPAVAATPAALSDAECDRLLDHTLELAVAGRPADARPDETERAKIRADARPGFFTRCRGMSRSQYACGVTAKATTEYQACDQVSSSSSTSNSSVAPGGMTPAAPRSP